MFVTLNIYFSSYCPYRPQQRTFVVEGTSLALSYSMHKRKFGSEKENSDFEVTIGDGDNKRVIKLTHVGEQNGRGDQVLSFTYKDGRSTSQAAFTLVMDGVRRTFHVCAETNADTFYVHHPSFGSLQAVKASRFLIPQEESSEKSGLYKAAMAGKVVKVLIKPGDTFKNGDTLLIMESMKMETKIEAHKDGVIGEVFVQEQAIVQKGDTLLSFAK